MRVPIAWGAPVGFLALATASLGCTWIESIWWRMPHMASYAKHPSPPVPDSGADSPYVVRPGDTLSSIGAFHGVSVAELAYMNDLDDPNRLEVGQHLLLPRGGAAHVSTPPPRRVATRTPVAKAAKLDASRAALDQHLHAADALLRTARFEEALSETESARAPLARLEGSPAARSDARERRVRLELLAATACIALGRDAAAERSFERALRTDADLELDPARVSPKVVRRFDETRRRLASASRPESVAERSAAP